MEPQWKSSLTAARNRELLKRWNQQLKVNEFKIVPIKRWCFYSFLFVVMFSLFTLHSH